MNSRKKDNAVCTGRYSFYSFLPTNLFEQLSQVSNLYFFAIGLLQMIPTVTGIGRNSINYNYNDKSKENLKIYVNINNKGRCLRSYKWYYLIAGAVVIHGLTSIVLNSLYSDFCHWGASSDVDTIRTSYACGRNAPSVRRLQTVCRHIHEIEIEILVFVRNDSGGYLFELA